MTVIVHEFEKSLAVGAAPENEPLWESIYRKAFPCFVGMVQNPRGNAGQFAGVDRWVALSNGRTLALDEKVRPKDWPDVLLEHVSNDRFSTPGWIEKDLAIDFLAYLFVPSRTCHLFHWLALRRVWLHFGTEWKRKAEQGAEGFRIVSADNADHHTLSVAVPLGVLRAKVASAGFIQLDATAAVTVAA